METNLKFNSAICTSREQSERLLALGLKRETADCAMMYYDGWHIGVAEDFDFDKDPVEPAWSFHRLLELCNVFYLGHRDYDSLINYLENLIKEGYFNKEYLEE